MRFVRVLVSLQDYQQWQNSDFQMRAKCGCVTCFYQCWKIGLALGRKHDKCNIIYDRLILILGKSQMENCIMPHNETASIH